MKRTACASFSGPLGSNFNAIRFNVQWVFVMKCIWKCRLQNGAMLSRPQFVKFHHEEQKYKKLS